MGSVSQRVVESNKGQLTVLQEAIGPEDLVIGDSRDLATGSFEPLGLLEAVATDSLVKMDDLDQGTVRGGQVIRLNGRANNLDWAVSTKLSKCLASLMFLVLGLP